VTVKILKNVRIEVKDGDTQFERDVHLIVFDKVCCHAVSTVTISNPGYLKLVTEDNVGIGQLFLYLSILPEFQLLDVGVTDQGFWRRYLLKCDGILCDIHEDFPNDVWQLSEPKF
jgi:hypothetical protein